MIIQRPEKNNLIEHKALLPAFSRISKKQNSNRHLLINSLYLSLMISEILEHYNLFA